MFGLAGVLGSTTNTMSQGGSIRGFLNDGTTDYKSHHHVEGLAFGHCDYSYRNLGRPSQIQIRHDASGLEVRVDDEHCIMTDKVSNK